MASLLLSTPSALLRLRENPNSNATGNHRFLRPCSLESSQIRFFPPISASLLFSPPPPPPLLSTSTSTFASLFSYPPPISPLFASTSTLFFARVPGGGSSIAAPLAVLASVIAKWLDLYSGVLMIRVLLSWFPQVPWEKQPLSAIRDLCDPYLRLFRNIIPAVFNIDLSPLLAFGVLSMLRSILSGIVI